jgi:hypothetical protein
MAAKDYDEYHDYRDLAYGEDESWEEVKDAKEFLQSKSDEELFDIILSKKQSDVNSNSINFPAWDIAYKLKMGGWKPSSKQRSALENVMAYYMANEE